MWLECTCSYRWQMFDCNLLFCVVLFVLNVFDKFVDIRMMARNWRLKGCATVRSSLCAIVYALLSASFCRSAFICTLLSARICLARICPVTNTIRCVHIDKTYVKKSIIHYRENYSIDWHIIQHSICIIIRISPQLDDDKSTFVDWEF